MWESQKTGMEEALQISNGLTHNTNEHHGNLCEKTEEAFTVYLLRNKGSKKGNT